MEYSSLDCVAPVVNVRGSPGDFYFQPELFQKIAHLPMFNLMVSCQD